MQNLHSYDEALFTDQRRKEFESLDCLSVSESKAGRESLKRLFE
jgi:hypothetical protein